jgi:two-component system response regulator MtrA
VARKDSVRGNGRVDNKPMNGQTKQILVVDDDPFIAEIISTNLNDKGFQVKTADNGQSALDYIAENSIDLIILDIRMPGLNGYEVLKELKSKSDIPVIMLSGIADPDSLVWSLELGAVDYIRKPFQANELVARVRAKLRRATV